MYENNYKLEYIIRYYSLDYIYIIEYMLNYRYFTC